MDSLLKPGNRFLFRRLPVSFALLVMTLATTLPMTVAHAQDSAAEACEEAARLLRDSDDLVGALAEAQWCLDGIKEMQDKQTLAVFPDNVGDFTGEEPTRESAFGMSLISRNYNSGSDQIKVSMAQGALAGQGLAALANLAAQFAGDSSRKFRVQRRTVIQLEESGDQMFSVQLRSGGLLNVGSNSASLETVKEFLEALPIAEIDDALAQ